MSRPWNICYNKWTNTCMFSRKVPSNSLQPQRLQPTAPLSMGFFSGKTIGVGCRFLLQWTNINALLSPDFIQIPLLLFSCPAMSDSLRHHGLQHARLPCPSLLFIIFFFSPVPGFCSRYGIIFSHHVTFLAMIFSQTSLVFDNLGSTGELQA